MTPDDISKIENESADAALAEMNAAYQEEIDQSRIADDLLTDALIDELTAAEDAARARRDRLDEEDRAVRQFARDE